MFKLYCPRSNHPDDDYYYCRWLREVGITLLARTIDSADNTPSISPNPDNTPPISSGSGTGDGGGKVEQELPTWLLTMIDDFRATSEVPTPNQLVTLVSALKTAGFNSEALMIARHIEAHTPLIETEAHIHNAFVQAQAFEALNQPEASKILFEKASGWIRNSDSIRSFSRSYAPTSKMTKKLAAQKPEGLILVAQKYYTKGTYKKVLAVTQYIDGHVPLGNQPVHAQNSLIRAQALEKLNDVSAAAASMETAADLTNMMRVQSQIDLAFERATQIR